MMESSLAGMGKSVSGAGWVWQESGLPNLKMLGEKCVSDKLVKQTVP